MQGNIRPVTTSLLGLLVLSLTLFPPAHAGYVGNDNGEFGTRGTPSYVFIQEAFDTCCGLHWTASPPIFLTSLQYNPDAAASFCCQYGVDWFQTITFTNNQGCVSFSIEVYNMPSGLLDWRSDYPANGCITVSGILNYGAIWYIQENVDVFNKITSVGFGLTANGGLSYTFYPPYRWSWLKSNVCWCGTNGGSTTYDSAGGHSFMGSNQHVYAIGPPSWIATAENSNMRYSCFSNSDTSLMSQLFSANGGHC